MANVTPQEMAGKMMADAFSRSGPAAQTLSDPIVETPMVVTLDELFPYELDPRITRNPRYGEIKASIRERGLDAPPSITRRPGANHFIIRSGGNTRLAILRELWSETKDERFFRISCLFRPWTERGEIVALTGHLAESELHGGLTFIERALGIQKAQELYEQESGKILSQSELARRLGADGYPIPQSHISRMQDAVCYLLPAIPNVLYGGLGRHQAERLAVLRKAAEWAWESRSQGKAPNTDFATLFHEVLAQFDTQPEAFTAQRVQDELIGQMSELLGIDYNVLELDIVNLESRQRALISSPSVPAEPLAPAARSDPAVPAQPPAPPGGLEPSPKDEPPGEIKPGSAIRQEPAPETPPVASATQPATDDDESQRLQGHIVSPAASTERLQAIQQLVSEHTGEERQDFRENALRAIPVQAGGLFPITDVWYIEAGLDTPDGLRTHIAQFAREIAGEAQLADCIEATESGLGFVCLPLGATSVTTFGRTTLALLNALGRDHSLDLPAGTQTETSDLNEALGALLLGHLPGQVAAAMPRLSDTGLVKLFRLLRLARRLLDLQADAIDEPTG
ncbi:ParB family protein [Pseudomonas aeruginosa]